jgi:hypothetical protein
VTVRHTSAPGVTELPQAIRFATEFVVRFRLFSPFSHAPPRLGAPPISGHRRHSSTARVVARLSLVVDGFVKMPMHFFLLNPQSFFLSEWSFSLLLSIKAPWVFAVSTRGPWPRENSFTGPFLFLFLLFCFCFCLFSNVLKFNFSKFNLNKIYIH